MRGELKILEVNKDRVVIIRNIVSQTKYGVVTIPAVLNENLPAGFSYKITFERIK